jgi:hypothetical protein
MKIRATAKVLNISKIKPVADDSPTIQSMPGEWYAGVLSLLQPGKLAIHFLHTPTYISIIIPGKSLNKAIPFLPARIENLLKRTGYESLIPQYQIDTTPEVFKTNNKSMLGYLNQMKLEIECLLTYRYPPGEIDFDDLETNYMRYLFRGKLVGSNFTYPYQILTKLKESNQSHV